MTALIQRITKRLANKKNVEDVVLGAEAWVEYR